MKQHPKKQKSNTRQLISEFYKTFKEELIFIFLLEKFEEGLNKGGNTDSQ